MKIALFGGTFDPVHLGHIAMAHKVRTLVDKVIILPCAISPHKLIEHGTTPPAPAPHRLDMLHLAFNEVPDIEISDFELETEEPSFTYLTIAHFRKLHPLASLHLVIGQDQFQVLPTWAHFNDWRTQVAFIVFDRKRTQPISGHTPLGLNVQRIENFDFPQSSSAIRKALACGQPVEDRLSPSVLQYIIKHKIYRN
ncbi:MAG: nicotinate (nicotinamide) nucleotide adenylyltransferase [Verrucomicrobiota bacterium]|nr:nicotinate (nicotinamide) nucleotide adenylyltransferase [Verrucomicrobiota bacterium]